MQYHIKDLIYILLYLSSYKYRVGSAETVRRPSFSKGFIEKLLRLLSGYDIKYIQKLLRKITVEQGIGRYFSRHLCQVPCMSFVPIYLSMFI